MRSTVAALPSLGRKIAEGGEALVFEDPSNPAYLIKQYKSPKVANESRRLDALDGFLAGLRPSVARQIRDTIVIPEAIYRNDTGIEGVRIRRVSEEFYFSVSVANYPTERKLLEATYLMQRDFATRKAIRSTDLPAPSFYQRIEIAVDLLDTLISLWEAGAVYGDLSARNVLWTLSPLPRIRLLEGDSLAFPRLYGAPDISSRDFQPFARLPTPHDAFAVDRSVAAVIVWRVLAGELRGTPTDDPADSTLRAHSAIREAIIRAYTQGTPHALEELRRELDCARGDSERAARVSYARGCGFARTVARHLGMMSTPEALQLHARATEQLALESQLESNPGAFPARTLQRLRLISDFALDLTPSAEQALLRPTRDVNDLIRLGQFEEASLALSAQQQSRPLTPTHMRALQHALASAPPPSVAVETHDGIRSLSWSWPVSPIVNVAVIRFRRRDGAPGSARVERRSMQPLVRMPEDLSREAIPVTVEWGHQPIDGLTFFANTDTYAYLMQASRQSAQDVGTARSLAGSAEATAAELRAFPARQSSESKPSTISTVQVMTALRPTSPSAATAAHSGSSVHSRRTVPASYLVRRVGAFVHWLKGIWGRLTR